MLVKYSHGFDKDIHSKSFKASILKIALLGILQTNAQCFADVSNFPDTFPMPMTFRSFDSLKPGTEAFKKRLEGQAPFPFIHSPGSDDKSKIVKSRWPNKIVTLQDAYGGVSDKHFAEVWPGHFLYQAGTLVTKDISENDQLIPVKDVSRIAKNNKIVNLTNKNFPFSLVIYALDEAGKPDWSRAEHVTLDSLGKNGIKVRRGQFGSRPLAFKAGKAVAATHMMYWTKQWQLNFSLHCPRGGPGNLTAAEWFARLVAQRLPATGADGIEFDVGRWTWGAPAAHPMDVNNDQIVDYGYIDGINSFGLGGRVFFSELRKILGPNKTIQADSNDAIFGVRGWKDLNGIQMESFPASNDYDSFSEAFLHLRLWSENAEVKPRFSYPFTKTTTTTYSNVRLPGGRSADFHFRVGLASACLVGMPHPFASLSSDNFDPANLKLASQKIEKDFGVFDWDEYHAGAKNDWQWLGRPTEAAKQDLSNLQEPNLLAKTSWEWKLAPGFAADKKQNANAFHANVERIPDDILPGKRWFGVRLAPKGKTVRLTPGKEYTIEFEARGDDSWNYAGKHFDRVPRMITIGGAVMSKNEKPISALVDNTWRNYRISFIAASSSAPTPVFGVSEQIGTTEIRNIKLFMGGAERWSREFENGLVLLNMTTQPWQFSMPKAGYIRLKGKQAPDVNTGEAIEKEVIVPARDAVFLIKR